MSLTKNLTAIFIAFVLALLCSSSANAATPTAKHITASSTSTAIYFKWAKGSSSLTYKFGLYQGGRLIKTANYLESAGSGSFTGLSPNTQYKVDIVAIRPENTTGDKETGPTVTSSVKTAPKNCVSPYFRKGKAYSTTAIKLEFNERVPSSVEQRPTHYYIEYATNSNMTGKKTVTINRTSSYILKGLSPKTEYYITVNGYYLMDGQKIWGGRVSKMSKKTRGPAIKPGDANSKVILNELQTSKSSDVMVKLVYPVSNAGSRGYWESLCCMEALYQPYFQRAVKGFCAGGDDWEYVWFLGTRPYSAAKARGDKANAKINAIVKKAKKYKSKKKQVEYVNNAICKTCSYDKTKSKADIRNPYGCLVKKKAVCQGYAETFYACMYRLKIPCEMQSNKSGSHVWNKVKVSGKWTHIDVTWNDSSGKLTKYMWLSDSKMKKVKNHQF